MYVVAVAAVMFMAAGVLLGLEILFRWHGE